MALTVTHKGVTFGVGDKVKVTQKIKEGDKVRSQIFEGLVLGIRGREENKSFTVRRIGAQQIGIERIFPLSAPTVEKIEVTREGTSGVSRAKLYYTREKAKREIDIIYSRAKRRSQKESSSSKKVKARKRSSK